MDRQAFLQPGKRMPWFPGEECPGSNAQTEQLDGQGDQLTVTADVTSQLGISEEDEIQCIVSTIPNYLDTSIRD